MAYVITLLSRRACEWGTAVWEANAPECQTFTQFAEAMRGVFDRSVAGPAATRQLFRIWQGQRPVSGSGLLPPPQAGERGNSTGQYFNGLSDRLLDELNTCDLPTSLDGLVELTLRVDARLADRRTSRHLRDRSRERSCTRSRAPTRATEAPDMEPMQVGRAKLSVSE